MALGFVRLCMDKFENCPDYLEGSIVNTRNNEVRVSDSPDDGIGLVVWGSDRGDSVANAKVYRVYVGRSVSRDLTKRAYQIMGKHNIGPLNLKIDTISSLDSLINFTE